MCTICMPGTMETTKKKKPASKFLAIFQCASPVEGQTLLDIQFASRGSFMQLH